MSEVIGNELRPRGVLNRRERVTLFLGTPLLLAFLCVEMARLWGAFQGRRLLLTGLVQPELSVARSDGLFPFVLGLALHLVIVAMLSAFLLSQVGQARRLFRSKRG